MANSKLPEPLPETLTVRFKKPLMKGILTYTIYSDVTYSRLVQRAVEKELDRLARKDPKLKAKLERAMQNGTSNNNAE
jgi:hypothetical protein